MDYDEIDLKILELLSNNSRISYSDIARNFGFSDVAIKKRVDKLIEKGLIRKFTTDVDYKKLGKNVTAFILLKTRSDKTREIAEQLLLIDGVESVYLTLGVFDVLAKIHCDDVVALKKLTEEKLNEINGILEIRPAIVSEDVQRQKE